MLSVEAPVTQQTTASHPGVLMLDLTVQLNRPADIYFVVTPGTVEPSASQVIDAATAASANDLSDLAVACGEASIPREGTNFTFTVTAGYDTQECLEYQQLIDTVSDDWARANRCTRCPDLQSDTQYTVRPALSLMHSMCLLIGMLGDL